MTAVTKRTPRRPPARDGLTSRPADGPGADGAPGPLRRCLVTGESLPPERLVRFVVGPDGDVVPDLARELPGRGVWVTATRAALDEAVRRKVFGRAFARHGGPANPTVPADLADRVERLLARRAAHWLGLARRAGHVVAGYEKVREAIAAGEVRLLVAAADGSPDGRRKVAGLAPRLEVVDALNGAELSMALGRENVVHAALQPGRLAARFLGEARRLAGFRSDAGAPSMAQAGSGQGRTDE
jgi:predicted RNA-binding protein YlxR (DUF448 family)